MIQNVELFYGMGVLLLLAILSIGIKFAKSKGYITFENDNFERETDRLMAFVNVAIAMLRNSTDMDIDKIDQISEVLVDTLEFAQSAYLTDNSNMLTDEQLYHHTMEILDSLDVEVSEN